MSRIAILLGVLVLQACASHRQAQLHQLDLPSHTALNCCWQSQESILISSGGRSTQILSVLELVDDHLTIVILDPLGRSLATFQQDASGLHTRTAPDGWDPRLSRQMLLAIYLDQLSASEWQFTQAGWSAEINEQRRVLRYNDSVKLFIEYDTNQQSQRRRQVHFADQALTLEIKTLSRTVL